MTGPLPDIVRLLAGHELFTSFITFTTKRAQDKNAATKLLLFEYNGNVVETKRSNLDDFTIKVAKEQKEKLELASRRVIDTLDRMSAIFLPSDPLLKSAGVFPVFYWFIRQNDPKEDRHVREFLNNFEKTRKENRDIATNTSLNSLPDSELMTFDRFNRSTDDQRSHVERHRILAKRFKEYLKMVRK